MSKKIINKDLIIIGGGPAGLTSAIYASRAKLDLLLLENQILGGQVRNSNTIENYPGFKKIKGTELADIMQQQAEELGAIIDEFDNIERVDFSDGNKLIETSSYTYRAKAVIIASGATPKKLPIPNEEKYSGKGVHYCAVCDGAVYEGKNVAVVGGGNSALEEALFLTKFAKKVVMIRRHDYFNGEKSTIEEVMNHQKIEVLFNEDLVNVEGDQFVKKAIIKNAKDNKMKEIDIDAVFGYIGTEPKTELFKEYLTLEHGYIVTDENMNTNIKGVYAAGDVRKKLYRQITTAVADGTIAALEAERYLVANAK
jgi:thioredoxin reductase (NADPH)